MSTIKNGPILLYCHFKKKNKRAWNQFSVSSIEPKTIQKCFSYSTVVFDQISLWQYVAFKIYKHQYNFHYVAMPMVTSQSLKSVDFTKTQKSKYLENKIFLVQINKKIVKYSQRATLWQKKLLQRMQPLRHTLKNLTKLLIWIEKIC